MRRSAGQEPGVHDARYSDVAVVCVISCEEEGTTLNSSRAASLGVKLVALESLTVGQGFQLGLHLPGERYRILISLPITNLPSYLPTYSPLVRYTQPGPERSSFKFWVVITVGDLRFGVWATLGLFWPK